MGVRGDEKYYSQNFTKSRVEEHYFHKNRSKQPELKTVIRPTRYVNKQADRGRDEGFER